MKKIILFLILVFITINVYSQYTDNDIEYESHYNTIIRKYNRNQFYYYRFDTLTNNKSFIKAINIPLDSIASNNYNGLDSIEMLDIGCDSRKKNYHLTSLINRYKDVKYLFIRSRHTVNISYDKDIYFSKLLYLDFDCYFTLCKKLPEFVYNESSLISLRCELKNENSINDSIIKLEKLQLLNIFFSRLNAIPKCIYELKNLNYLVLMGRKGNFKELDNEITKLDKLKDLTISIKLTKKSILILSKLKNLKQLVVNSIDDESIQYLNELSFIKRIEFWDLNDDKTIEKITKVLPNTDFLFSKI